MYTYNCVAGSATKIVEVDIFIKKSVLSHCKHIVYRTMAQPSSGTLLCIQGPHSEAVLRIDIT